MKLHRLHKPIGVFGSLCLAGYTSVAGTASYNFDTDPSSVLQLFGTSTWQATDGNPASGGYLSITDALNGQRGAIIFDDFDNGLVVKAFSFSMDVRIGGGTDSPADGISINYVRAGDPVLADPLNGWATGPNGEADLPEEGATTGLGIGFDAWYSGGDGSWNNNRVSGSTTLTDDVIGMSVRLDNTLIYQYAMPTLNGACDDTTSLQTGPQDANNAGSPDLLCWKPLSATLAEDGTLKVSYKGAEITPPGGLHTTFAPSPGRLVFVGRTGGANQNNHVDNIVITTVPATTPTIGTVSSNPTGFQFDITDAGPIQVNPATITMTFNGAAITPSSAVKTGSDTLVKASTLPNLIPAGSTNTVVVTFKDGTGNTYSATRAFVEGPYAIVPPSFALAPAAVDTSAPGFKVRSFQTATDNQNSLALTEMELAGLLGPNLSDTNQLTDNGFFDESGVINYAKATDGQQGNFGGETTLPGFPGLGASEYDHNCLEILGYVNFPAAGTYTWGVSSDDGFKVSVAPSVGEKLNTVLLGEFNGGRGASIPGTEFNFYVGQAGYYPVRTVWENGGGGANVELFSVQSDGSLVLVNDAATPGAIKFYQTAKSVLPYVSFVSPEPGLYGENRGTGADNGIEVDLVDGTSAVINQSSIALSMNGAALSPTITKSGKTTKVALSTAYPNLLPIGTNTAQIVYSAGNGGSVTQSWKFIVAKYGNLDPGLSVPLGSGDSTKPGFQIKTWSLDILSPTAGTAGANQAINIVSFAEQELLGLFGDNHANLAGAVGGYFAEPAVINYDIAGPDGNFQPESPFPGIPGTLTYSNPTDNFALEIQTWIEFPAAGYYTFGVNSDDGFATYEATGPAPLYALNINAPTAIAGRMGAVSAGSDEGGIGLPLPTVPITGKVVYAQPPLADSDITNTNEVKGNIVLIDRGVSAFTDKLNRAKAAGAIGVIVANNRDETSTDGILPIVMGGNGAPMYAVMVNIHDGQKIKDHLADAGGVTVSMGQDPTPKLGFFNAGRGASDTLFSFGVPSAGIYPIRTVYFEGGGGANAEFFSVANGTKTLINDTANGGLKAYAAVKAVAKPTISISGNGTSVTITYTGTLQSTSDLSGTPVWTAVSGASSPLVIPAASEAAAKFYRSSN